MKKLMHAVRWTGMVLLVAGLMFASGVFTALLYGKMTGELDRYLGRHHEHIAYAEELKGTGVGEGQAEGAGDEPEAPDDPPAPVPPAARLDAPLILQYPELPRGCEITTLTMLINYYGLNVNKIQLASEMKRDETPIRYEKGNIVHWGNPSEGFVGDITLNSPGLGIYHEALFPLLETYVPTAVNLTGADYGELERKISEGIPVMVWISVRYDVPDNWMEWDSPTGRVRATTSMHAALMVGYDERYVYVNDPLKQQKGYRVEKKSFIKSWEAFGKQALSYEEFK